MEHEIDFILIQESYQHGNKVISFPLSWTVVNATDEPRVATICCRQICRRASSLDQQQEILKAYPKAHHLLAGDFNAHSELWGYSDTDARGRQRYKLKRRTLKLFSQKARSTLTRAEQDLEHCHNTDDVDNFTSILIKELQAICDSTFQIKSPKVHYVANWWTKSLRIQRSKTRALRRKMKSEHKSERREELSIIYKKAQAQYKKAILEAKLYSWRAFCTNNKNPYGVLHKIATNKVFAPPIHKVYVDGTNNPQPTEEHRSTIAATLTKILDAVFQDDNTLDASNPEHPAYLLHSTTEDDVSFTQPEVCAVLRNLPRNKAPGPDSLDYNIVKAMHQAKPTFLKNFYNKLLQLRYFPKPFKTGQSYSFPKERKGPRTIRPHSGPSVSCPP
ncbi:uncharacterized protein LOC118182928 [Stegodyphus dumicola]|uniref:uncharacterized protein LOC118182928 n=1 Tax=Stegodyphus dumicola TaxID=202533 RepID=UPI0015A82F73|nr:uncharacterized protein LOC118182928 [Stegodyphus dumicola]